MADQQPFFERISEAIIDALESALEGRNPNLPRLKPPNDQKAAARAGLEQLRTRAKAVDSASTPNGWASALGQWHSTLTALGGDAFGSGQNASAVFARVLQERAPRAANALGAAGVISSPTPGRIGVNFPRLRDVMTDPSTALGDSHWNKVISQAVASSPAGEAPAASAVIGPTSDSVAIRVPKVAGLTAGLGGVVDAVSDGAGTTSVTNAGDESMAVGVFSLMSLLLDTRVALSDAKLTVAPSPRPTADQDPDWSAFSNKAAEWLSFTIASGDKKKAPNQSPGGLFDFASGFEPDLAATIAIRSNRRTKNGKLVNGFELWWLLTANGNQVDVPSWEYGGESNDGWTFRIKPGISAGFGYDGAWHGALRPLSQTNLPPPTEPVVVSFGRDTIGEEPDIVIGPPGDTRLIVKDVGLFLKVRNDTHPAFEIGAFMHGFALVLTNRWFRSAGATNSTFKDGLRFDLDLDIAYVEGKGLLFNLDHGLDVTFQVNSDVIGGKADSPLTLTLHSVRVRVPIEATANSIRVRGEAMFHASIRMGPLILVFDGAGAWIGHWPEPLAPVPYFGLIAPHGIGLELILPLVTGGGFLDYTGGPSDRYGGLLHLKIAPLEVVAFGLHELIGPPGQENRKTSVVMVIGVRFSPGVQLGFGLALRGVGGLIGINRRANTDALRERLTSGAAGNLLFPENPVHNAPAILGDLNAVFPAADGMFVVGPTLQIEWLRLADGAFARLDIGVFLELPGPSKLVILGSLRAAIPKAEGMLRIRLDVMGVFDFQKKLIWFDATLINSEALTVFTLTGDAALRSSYGDDPYVALSIGGFHPHFKPEPAVFPELTRIALTLKKAKEDLEGFVVRAEAYFAITTNSIQFGGAVEIGLFWEFVSVLGFVRLDVLFQFSPFYFEVSIAAGFRLRFGSVTLLGLRVSGTLSGPGPVTLAGTFTIEILFFEISFSANITLGKTAAQPAPEPIASVAQALKGELSEPKNLSSTGGGDNDVSVQPRSAPRALVSPLGGLAWMQKRAPLNLLIERFESRPLAAAQTLAVEASIASHGDVHDWFSPASFATLSESEGLNRPSFERLDAGISLGFAGDASDKVTHTPSVIEIRIPDPPKPATWFNFSGLLFLAISARTGPAAVKTTAPKFKVTRPQFVVRDKKGSILLAARSRADAHQRARRSGGHALAEDDLVDLGDL